MRQRDSHGTNRDMSRAPCDRDTGHIPLGMSVSVTVSHKGKGEI